MNDAFTNNFIIITSIYKIVIRGFTKVQFYAKCIVLTSKCAVLIMNLRNSEKITWFIKVGAHLSEGSLKQGPP